MKVMVTREFIDIHTGVLHENGSTFECDDERFNEIESAGTYIVPVIEVESSKKKGK